MPTKSLRRSPDCVPSSVENPRGTSTSHRRRAARSVNQGNSCRVFRHGARPSCLFAPSSGSAQGSASPCVRGLHHSPSTSTCDGHVAECPSPAQSSIRRRYRMAHLGAQGGRGWHPPGPDPDQLIRRYRPIPSSDRSDGSRLISCVHGELPEVARANQPPRCNPMWIVKPGTSDRHRRAHHDREKGGCSGR